MSKYKKALTVVIARMGIGTAEVNERGNFSAVSPALCQMLGFSDDELLATPAGRFFEFPDLKADAWPAGVSSTGEKSSPVTEFRVTRRDGTTVWLKAALSDIPGERSGEREGWLLAVQETTVQKNNEQERRETAERFIKAQEAERSRIARELHDDIGQSLAIHAIQFQRAGQPISDKPGEAHPGPRELVEKVQSIASRVSRLSHQLDASKVEYVGLSNAVQGTCREFSQAQRIPVEYSSNDIPRKVPGDIGLCFLRIVQEALHNVAKHSHATNVRVELSGNPDELRVTILDNGIGFDMAQARLASGVGLISMRERARLAGGEFNVESNPGDGTRIWVRVPLL